MSVPAAASDLIAACAAMPVPCLVTSSAFVVLEWSPAAERLLGWARSDLLRRDARGLLFPAAAWPALESILSELQGTAQTAELVCDTLTREGRSILCHWRAAPLRDESDRLVGIVACAEDLTGRVAAEQTLQREAALGAAIDKLAWNAVFAETIEEMAGLTLEQASRLTASPQGYVAYLDPSASQATTPTFSRAVLTGRRPRGGAAGRAGESSGGEAIRSQLSVPAIYGETLVGEIAVANSERDYDETDRRALERLASIFALGAERQRADRALSESDRRFRELFETIHLAAVMLDSGGHLTFCNDHFLRLTSWSRAEALGKSWFELFVAPAERERMARDFTAAVAAGAVVAYDESHIVTRSGERRLMSWNHTLLRHHDGRVVGVASFGRDVTEHRRLEEQLRQAQKMEAVGTLASGVAHDFNNFLTGILAYGDRLRRRLDADDPLAHDADQILETAQRAARLTRSLLAFGRKQPLEVRRVDLNDVVMGLEALVRPVLGEHVALAIVLADAPIVVMADVGQIEQVLLNLATNARDAMPDGGRLTIATERIDDRLARLSVADTGVGMDEVVKRRVFEPFFTTKKKGHGTGLGLSMAYGIVQQHGGQVVLSSAPGSGTTVSVELPLAGPAAAKPSKPASRTAGRARTRARAAAGSRETILIVEDTPHARRATRATLESHGYRVVEAADGVEALRLVSARADDIRLVLADVVMPRMDGRTLRERLRVHRPDLKVLLVTGYADDDLQRRGIATGSEELECLRKPLDPAVLLARIRSQLDRPVK